MIYDNICKLAQEKKISINELEQEVGLSRGSLCKWNIVSPSVRNLKKVADYFGVSLEYFLEDKKVV